MEQNILPTDSDPMDRNSQSRLEIPIQPAVEHKNSGTRIVLYGLIGILLGPIVGLLVISLLGVESQLLAISSILFFTALMIFLSVKLALRFKDKIKIIDKTNLIGLSGAEKCFVIIFSVILPIVSGFLLYYYWLKKHPLKAKQSINIFAAVQILLLLIWLAFKFF